MLTLSLTEAVRLAFLNGGDFTQGCQAASSSMPQPFAGDRQLPMYYVLAVALLALGLLVTLAPALLAGSAGSSARCGRTRTWPRASAPTSALPRHRVRVLPARWAGWAAAFFAVFTRASTRQSFTVEHSIYFMLFCFLGGLDFVSGADGRRLSC